MATQTTIIAPSVGHALVNLQGGVGASPGFDAIDYRRAWSGALFEGVLSSTAWVVKQNTVADLHVLVDANVGPGAYVQGDAITLQGLYYVAPHGSQINFDVGTNNPPNAVNPRIDRVVLRVYDNTHDASGLNEAHIEYIPGTPTSGATLDNETGAPAVPNGSIELATVYVGANATSIANANIRDKRAAGGVRRYNIGEPVWRASANAPFGCVAANGSALKRNQYVELYSEIGTIWGVGDGSTTFGSPDLRSRSPVGVGQGAGLTNRVLGAYPGSESHLHAIAIPGLSVPDLNLFASATHHHGLSGQGWAQFVYNYSGQVFNIGEVVGGPSAWSNGFTYVYGETGLGAGYSGNQISGSQPALGGQTDDTTASVGGIAMGTTQGKVTGGANINSDTRDHSPPTVAMNAFIYAGKA
jgi:microcystin-dependent protein